MSAPRDALDRDCRDLGPAAGFRQEPTTAGPGLPVTTTPVMKGNPMVEPITPDVRFMVSGRVLAGVESAYENYRRALVAVAAEFTPAHKRELAKARRALADAYHELGMEFLQNIEVSSALAHHAYAHLLDQADEDEMSAASMEARAARGDGGMSAPVTFTVPAELHARSQAAYDAYAQAVSLVADEMTAAHARGLSAARVELASVYRELASNFSGSRVMFHAVDHMAAQQFNDALDDDRWAERLEASTFGGDVE